MALLLFILVETPVACLGFSQVNKFNRNRSPLALALLEPHVTGFSRSANSPLPGSLPPQRWTVERRSIHNNRALLRLVCSACRAESDPCERLHKEDSVFSRMCGQVRVNTPTSTQQLILGKRLLCEVRQWGGTTALEGFTWKARAQQMRVTVTEQNSIIWLPPCLAYNSAWPGRTPLVMGPTAFITWHSTYTACASIRNLSES